MDYSDYQKLKNKSVFKQLRFLIGNHPTLAIILTGLYISSMDTKSRIKVIEDNRQRIHDRYGKVGVSIMNLAKTGFIEGYVKWLSLYNVNKNPSQKGLIEFYENILKDWQERSFFVQNFMDISIITNNISSKINIGKEVFFVFASGNAIKITERAIDEIEKTGLIRENKYHINNSNINSNKNEKVWIFEKSD